VAAPQEKKVPFQNGADGVVSSAKRLRLEEFRPADHPVCGFSGGFATFH